MFRKLTVPIQFFLCLCVILTAFIPVRAENLDFTTITIDVKFSDDDLSNSTTDGMIKTNHQESYTFDVMRNGVKIDTVTLPVYYGYYGESYTGPELYVSYDFDAGYYYYLDLEYPKYDSNQEPYLYEIVAPANFEEELDEWDDAYEYNGDFYDIHGMYYAYTANVPTEYSGKESNTFNVINDLEFEFDNERTGVIPTGLSFRPSYLLALIGLISIFALVFKKKTNLLILFIIPSLSFMLSIQGVHADNNTPLDDLVIDVPVYIFTPENVKLPDTGLRVSLAAVHLISDNYNTGAVVWPFPAQLTPQLREQVLAGYTAIDDTLPIYSEAQSGDAITIPEGSSYGKVTVPLDLTGVTFAEPGIYSMHLIVFEDQNGDTSIAQSAAYSDGDFVLTGLDYAYDSEVVTTRLSTTYNLYLQIMIGQNDDGELYEMSHWFLIWDENRPNSDMLDGANYKKTPGAYFEVDSHDVKIKKVVSGNQGNKTDVFDFVVTINAEPNSTYSIDVSGAPAGRGNPSSVTTDENGYAQVVVHLSHDEYVIIKDMNRQNTIQITERDNTYSTIHKLFNYKAIMKSSFEASM